MHWVEMYNCTQKDTNHANVRFERVSRYDNHTVEDCSFHHGLGRALEFTKASGINVKRNNIYWFFQFGMYFDDSSSINVDDNVVMGIHERDLGQLLDDAIDE